MFERQRVMRAMIVCLAVAGLLAMAFPAPSAADTRTRPSERSAGELSLLGIGLSEFEVDGNALNDVSVPGDDWDLLYGGGGSYQIWTGIMEDTLGVYRGSTDLDDFPDLSWDDGTVPDKADILHAYVAVYAGNHVFFGADRYATTGTTCMGYWLLQNPVTLTGVPTGGGFDGNRTVGDILILANFENGGGTVVIGVYKWLGVGNLQAMPVDSNTSFAVVNGAPTSSPWPFVPKSGPVNIFGTGAFFEGGADLGALGIQGCFTHFIAETRASASLRSALKDFVIGALPTKPYVSINPDPASMCAGDPGVTLCANIVPGTGAPPFTYAWTGTGIADPTDSCITVGAGFAAGDYQYGLVVTGCNGCSSDTAYVTLTVNAAPTGSIDGPSTVCPGSTNSHCGPLDMDSYSWSISGNGTITGATDQRCVEVLAGAGCDQSYILDVEFTSGAGCEGSARKTVTVDDTTPPVITCPSNITVQCTESIDPARTGSATATDDCGGVIVPTYSDVVTAGGCPQAYTIARTWRAADACSNVSTCVQTITIQDTRAPWFVDALPSDVTVECNQVPMPPTITATDSCDTSVPVVYGPVVYGEVRTDGVCPANYTLRRTWTATDDCGNQVQHVQIITVRDTTAPEFVGALPGDTTVECDAVPAPPTITATDNCDTDVPVVYNQQRTDGSCPDSYTLTRTWTAADDCGNDVQHVQIITVRDSTDPRFVGDLPGNVTVECDNVPGAPTLTATDNCDDAVAVTYSEQRTDGTCPDNYTLTRTWTAADDCGNDVQHVQVITVRDTTDPRFEGPLPTDATVECDAVPAPPTITATDNCDTDVPVVYNQQRTDGSCPDSYTLTRTWTATDDCGNDVQHVQIVTVRDTTDPRFVEALPPSITVPCPFVSPPATLTATDNCDDDVAVDFDESMDPGRCPQEYFLTRTWTATDDCGNSAEHVQVVTVVDNGDPYFVDPLPGDTTVQCHNVPPAADLHASDACDPGVMMQFEEQRGVMMQFGEQRQAGSCVYDYTLVRTWTASDHCGNSVQHVQRVRVVDTDPPSIVCPPADTVQCRDDVPEPDIEIVEAWDNCGLARVSFEGDRSNGGSCPEIITRTYGATDVCGNYATCTQTIVVDDTISPSITCPDTIKVQCRADVPAPSPHSINATDNCDLDVEVVWVDDVSDGGTCPEFITRTYRAIDDCGNSDTCTQIIRVWDTTPPWITCPSDRRFECDQPIDFGHPGAGDNCDQSLSITFDDETVPGSNPYEYQIRRTWRAEDDCDNVATCLQVVTVYDETPPVITCPSDARFQCDETILYGEATATDNCDPDVLITFSDRTVPGSCPGEYQIVRTWTATDDAGNSDSCDQTVTVYDGTAPILLCPADITFECDDVGDPGDASARDNCDPEPWITSSDVIGQGQCAQEYTIVRTYTATDDCGNASTCVQRITIEDTTPPEITCPPDTSFEFGDQIDPGWPVVADNCDHEVVVTFEDRRIDGVCPQSYTIVRTWRAEDDCGNSATCEQRINVGDHSAPVITCPGDRTFECDDDIEFGQATAVDTGDPNPVITFVDVVIPGDCGQAFVVERTWTATDGCGNWDSCVQIVRVVDTTAPEIACPADRTFGCDQQIEFGEATATDNCDATPVITFADATLPGGSPQEYVIERTWTATDDCGNAASCVQRVMVEDNTAPTLSGGPDGRLLCAQPVVFTDPVADDNCDPDPVIRVASDGSVQGPGDCEVSYTRCWEAVDAAGNVSGRVCQTIIRYEDTVPPVLTCAPDKVILPGEPVIFDEPTVSDNCPIPGQEPPELQSSFSMSVDQAETTYTTCWIAFDLCGNQSEEGCQSITVSAPPEPPPYCTFICWNWTAACLKDPYNHEISTPPACLRDEHFFDVFPSGVTIGSHARPGLYTARWTTPGAVERFKCGYGLPAPLTRDYVDPGNYDLGVLQAEILTLRLNREFSCAGYFEEYGYPLGEGCFGEYVVPPEVLKFAGLTVDQFLAIADQAVAGDKSVLIPYGYSYQRLWAAAQYLNWIFGECNGYGSREASSALFSVGTGEGVVAESGSEAEQAAVPETFSMTTEPNPLRTSVTIRLALPAEGDVSVDLYDIQGRKVACVVRAHKAAGYHSVAWNGKDTFGASVVSGVYFCRVTINGEPMAMQKLMKL